ncbi:hypothetical protein [Mycolicibacterium sp.]|uniref:hypothetical protein n=1 Tax=Mycolicibacterium sp. TaxID=2320850 RepID=UPI00355EEDEA
MADRERVAQIIGETFTEEVERMQFSEIVDDESARDEDGLFSVDVEKVAEVAADRLAAEGLI